MSTLRKSRVRRFKRRSRKPLHSAGELLFSQIFIAALFILVSLSLTGCADLEFTEQERRAQKVCIYGPDTTALDSLCVRRHQMWRTLNYGSLPTAARDTLVVRYREVNSGIISIGDSLAMAHVESL